MVVKKVGVYFDKYKFTKEKVVEDLKAENYPYEFCFLPKDLSEVSKLLRECNEVWFFGKCEFTAEYRIAMEVGCDIWIMA